MDIGGFVTTFRPCLQVLPAWRQVVGTLVTSHHTLNHLGCVCHKLATNAACVFKLLAQCHVAGRSESWPVHGRSEGVCSIGTELLAGLMLDMICKILAQAEGFIAVSTGPGTWDGITHWPELWLCLCPRPMLTGNVLFQCMRDVAKPRLHSWHRQGKSITSWVWISSPGPRLAVVLSAGWGYGGVFQLS